MIDIHALLRRKGSASKREGVPDRALLHPGRAWAFGLLMAVVMLTSGSLYAIMLFEAEVYRIDNPATPPLTALSYDQEKIQDVLIRYRHRVTQFETLRERQGIPATIVIPTATTSVPEEETPTGTPTLR